MEAALVLFHNCDRFIHRPGLSSRPGAFHPGMSFALVGIMVGIHGEYFAYSFLADPFEILGSTVALNRLAAFVAAVIIGSACSFPRSLRLMRRSA